MAEHRIGDGRIPVTLDGREHHLVPTLEACNAISKMAGGINAAAQRCAALHFETICGVVGIGLEIDGQRLNPRQRDDMVPKAVYEQGLMDVAAACVRFCRVVANGGREILEPEEDEEEEREEASDDGPLGSATKNSTDRSTD